MKKVCVGISGGVDSATAAHLLLEQGYEVIGATMYLFDVQKEDGRVEPPEFMDEAREVCRSLGIEHHIIDLRQEFNLMVKKPFIQGYVMGRTPNPCVICNRKIKYGLFMDRVLELGSDFMATGHYVQIQHREKNGTFHLMKGAADRKDQSYYLCGLSETRLSRMIVPLGGYVNKAEVREIASRANSPVYEKKDSLGICFTQGKSAFEYLKTELGSDFGRGEFVLKDGTVLGQHDGYFRYTIGQKKDLPKYKQKSLVVIELEPKNSKVILGDEDDLYSTEMVVDDFNWIHQPQSFPWEGIFRIFTWGYDLKGQIEPLADGDRWKVVFDEPVRAIAKGQICVVYKDNEILGGGTIL